MKWKTNKVTSKINDVRYVRRFAWTPKKCEGGYTVWLEAYESVQKYMEIPSSGGTRQWVEIYCNYLKIYA